MPTFAIPLTDVHLQLILAQARPHLPGLDLDRVRDACHAIERGDYRPADPLHRSAFAILTEEGVIPDPDQVERWDRIWQDIGSSPDLARARRVLSIHEFRKILDIFDRHRD